MENQQDYKLNRTIFLMIIIFFALFLFYSLSQFFTAFLGAIMFYVLSRPLVEWLVKKKFKKSTAAIIVIFISFFIILLPIGLFAMMLYGKIVAVAENPQVIIEPVKNLDATFKQRFGMSIISEKNMNSIQSFGTTVLSTILNTSFNFFTTISMMYFFLYFMIQNINRMEAAIVFYLPFKRSKIILFGTELKAQTFSNSVVIPLIIVVHGLLAFGGYSIAGLGEPGFWGMITGLASIIPIVGTGIIWVPVSIYLMITGHIWPGLFVVIWGLLVIGISDNVIRFLLAKKMANVHPIVTILGVILGLKYFGITGLIFGPLLISYFLLLLKIYYMEYQKPVKIKKQTLLPSYFPAFLANQGVLKKKVKPQNHSAPL
jgi:predicted PurR-regulated permease PerM